MKSILLVKTFLGLVEMMSGLVDASFIKMIFFAPCLGKVHLKVMLASSFLHYLANYSVYVTGQNYIQVEIFLT